MTRLRPGKAPAAPTVAQVLDGYLADRAGRVVDLPRIQLCAKHLRRQLGWLAVEDLRPSHARAYANTRTAAGIGPGTIRRELLALRAALRWAQSERWIDAAPGMPAPAKPAPRDRWLTREEVDKLLAAAISPHVALFIRLATGSAARSGAILGLEWPAVDLKAGVIDFGRGVGNKRRGVVPIHAGLVAALAEAREAAQTPYVIEYNCRRVGSIKKAFARTVKRAGIGHCTPHDLRRSAGSWLLQADLPIELVSAMLGHNDIATTRAVYAHSSVPWLRTAADALAPAPARDVASPWTRNTAESA